MEDITGFTEEITGTAIYTVNKNTTPSVITFIIGEYVITIDTATSGAARWDYLENCIYSEDFIPSF